MKKKVKFSIKPNWYSIKITLLLGLISIFNWFFTLEPHVWPEYNYFLRPIRAIFDSVVPYSWSPANGLLCFAIVSVLTILYWYFLSCLIIFLYRLIKRRFPKEIKKLEWFCGKYHLLIFILIIVFLVVYVRFCQKESTGHGTSRCTFSPEIVCLEWIISASGNESDFVAFRFRNQMDETADFNFNATFLASKTQGICTGVQNLKKGAKALINCTFEDKTLLPIDGKAKFELTCTYKTKDMRPVINKKEEINTIKGMVYGTINE